MLLKVSDRWVGVKFTHEFSVNHLLLPDRQHAHTPLLDLTPLPVLSLVDALHVRLAAHSLKYTTSSEGKSSLLIVPGSPEHLAPLQLILLQRSVAADFRLSIFILAYQDTKMSAHVACQPAMRSAILVSALGLGVRMRDFLSLIWLADLEGSRGMDGHMDGQMDRRKVG